MIKKLLTGVLAFTLIMTACGCQLAQPESDNNSEQNRFVGFLVTTKPLFEKNIEENLENLLPGNHDDVVDGNFELPDEVNMQERVYAELVEETITDESGVQPPKNYEFKDVDAVAFARYEIAAEGDNGPYCIMGLGEAVCDVEDRFGGENNGISGTLWLAKSSGGTTLFINPVYQTADHRVFAVAPPHGQYISEGIKLNVKYQEDYTVTENGEKHKSVFTAELTIDVAEPARSVTVIQMDKNDKEIKREGFSADKLPEEFTPDDNAAYLIVVSECDGDSYRKIIQPDEETADVFVKSDGIFCKKKKFDIHW